jgi:hypothetical protein
MKDPFISTFGIEYTYLAKTKAYENDLSEAYTALVRVDLKRRKIPFFVVYNDSNAIEIASAPYKNWAELRKNFEDIQGVVAKYPLTTHRWDTYSGGGHIHAAFPDAIKKHPVGVKLFLSAIFRDITNRPYLNWIFNEWCNVKSAESLVYLPELAKRHGGYKIETWQMLMSPGSRAHSARRVSD